MVGYIGICLLLIGVIYVVLQFMKSPPEIDMNLYLPDGRDYKLKKAAPKENKSKKRRRI